MSVVSPQHCERINTCSTIAGAPDQPWRLRELTNRCPPILVEIITHFNGQPIFLNASVGKSCSFVQLQ